MRVKSCVASDGGGHTIQLSDEFGCVLRPKMISRFLKARGSDDRATVITYAFFHAFKFPDALSVHIKCKVIMHGFQIKLGRLFAISVCRLLFSIFIDKFENICIKRWRYVGTVAWIIVN